MHASTSQLTASQIAGRDQPNCAASAQLCSRPLHTGPPPAVGLLPNCAAPARRPLVAALAVRTARPRAANSRTHAVSRRLQVAPAETLISRRNRRATAHERDLAALTPGPTLLPPARSARNSSSLRSSRWRLPFARQLHATAEPPRRLRWLIESSDAREPGATDFKRNSRAFDTNLHLAYGSITWSSSFQRRPSVVLRPGSCHGCYSSPCMCLMSYIATSEPITAFKTDTLSILPPRVESKDLVRHFSYSNIRFVSSHTGCSCGFPSVKADEPVEYFDGIFDDKDDDERLKNLGSVDALLNLVRTCLDSGKPVELFPVWAGDEAEDPAGVIDLDVGQLDAQTFFFNEHYLYRISSRSAA